MLKCCIMGFGGTACLHVECSEGDQVIMVIIIMNSTIVILKFIISGVYFGPNVDQMWTKFVYLTNEVYYEEVIICDFGLNLTEVFLTQLRRVLVGVTENRPKPDPNQPSCALGRVSIITFSKTPLVYSPSCLVQI